MIAAALDIGSNSIHLVVVETDREKPFRVVASAKEAVRLGRSSARDQRLSAAAMDRAVDCLKRFRRVAESHGARELIAVATSAVREAANGDQFIMRAAEEAGVEIDLLSGIEEARLIALAVSVRHRQSAKQQALVIDIGGGSTELAVMKRHCLQRKWCGCTRVTLRSSAGSSKYSKLRSQELVDSRKRSC